MIVRDFSEKDIPNAIRYTKHGMQSGLFRVMKPSPTALMHFLRVAMADDKHFYLKVIDHDGEGVGGFLGHCFTPVFSADRIAEDLVIFLDERYRKKSGKVLIEVIRGFEEWAKRQNCKVIFFSINSGIATEAAAKMYNKLGYPPVGSIHGKVL